MPTFAITSRTASTISLTITAGGGETAFELEFNREKDFASDTSLLISGFVAGAHNIQGLPNGTPFWIRARKTNGGNGAWTAAQLAATLAVAPAGYAGFSMDKAGLVVPAPITDIATFGNVEAGFPVTNLLRDDPQSIWRIRAAGNPISFSDVVFKTSGEPIDTIALLGTMAGDEATWYIDVADSLADLLAQNGTWTRLVSNESFRASPTIGRRQAYHALRTFAAPATSKQFWRIIVFTDARIFIARHLVVGKMRSSVNASRGFGSAPIDMGNVARNRFGTPDRLPGWRGRVLDFECSWMSEAEYQTKWADLDTLVGLTKPVLIIQNSKQNVWLQDRIGFGEISQMRGEIQRGDRWSKRIEVKSLY